MTAPRDRDEHRVGAVGRLDLHHGAVVAPRPTLRARRQIRLPVARLEDDAVDRIGDRRRAERLPQLRRGLGT
jgi:hypothetical protein